MSDRYEGNFEMTFTGITGDRHPLHDNLIEAVCGIFESCELEDYFEGSDEGELVYRFCADINPPLAASDFSPDFVRRFGPCNVFVTVFLPTDLPTFTITTTTGGD
jgi:hypothetical protein